MIGEHFRMISQMAAGLPGHHAQRHAGAPRWWPSITRPRRLLTVCALVASLVLVSACGEPPTVPDADRPDIVLDLDTLEAETEFGTLHAQRADNSFVGALGDGQAIGVAFLDELGVGTQQEPMEIAVYLYDGSCFAFLLGEVDAEGEAILESDELRTGS